MVTHATRYDPYGMILATGSAGGTPVAPSTWTYQGRLDVSSTGTPLLDAGARFYAPGLSAFTQADTVMGQAQDPRSMNRFLYAEANPATLIDPDGHRATACDIGYDCTNGGQQVVNDVHKRPSNHHSYLSHRSTSSSSQAQADDARESAAHASASHAYAVTLPVTGRDGRIRGTAYSSNTNPLSQIIGGLGGVVYDNTAGIVTSIADAATHPGQVLTNAGLIGTALTHLDMTVQVASDDLGRGWDRYQQLPLDQQIRMAGDAVMAGVGPKVINVGATRVTGALRAVRAGEAGEVADVADAATNALTVYDPDFAISQTVASGTGRASAIEDVAASNGLIRMQTATGPIKYVDETGSFV